jgi:hypothetical protein
MSNEAQNPTSCQYFQRSKNPALLVGDVMSSCLRLSLKKKWFEMTKAGIKTEDYREVNHYWIKRLMSKKYNNLYPIEQEAIDGILKHIDPNYLIKNHSNNFDYNIMTLGYPKSNDTERILKLENKGIELRFGNPEWGAEPNKLYFVIMHGAVLA